HCLCSFAVRSPLHRCSATDLSSLSLSSVRLHHRGLVSVSVSVHLRSTRLHTGQRYFTQILIATEAFVLTYWRSSGALL
ncbi:hypothetical protein PIB30_084613, partial [Stylosanthes scabra]|nr:hypothetical protein [Stylosanthes scabra]